MTQNTTTLTNNQEQITAYTGQTVSDRREPMQAISFSKVIEIIKSSEEMNQHITMLRSIGDIEKQQDYKKYRIPYFTLGEFADNRLVKENFLKTKHVVLDYDHLGDKLQEFKHDLQMDPHVVAVFTSPRGDGLKVVCEMKEYVTTRQEFDVNLDYIASTFENIYGIKMDQGAKGAARACFFSFDPDIYVNSDHMRFNVIKAAPEAVQVKKSAQPIENFGLRGVGSGERNKTSAKLIGKFIQQGLPKDESYEFLRLWNQQNNPPMSEAELGRQMTDCYARFADPLKRLPVKFTAKDNCYIRFTEKKEERTVTTFTIEPKELLELDDTDCLRCDIVSYQGHKHKDVLIENADWHSKAKLLKAIGHQDCSFVGNDQEIQALCAFVNNFVPVRKKGTKVIGLHDGIWVTKNSNITSTSISNELTIIPYDKGSDAFLNKIAYESLSDDEYAKMAKDFYENILLVNEHKIIAPVLGWAFAAPVKPQIMKLAAAFPLLFMHGGQGDGKTSTAQLVLRLSGYKDAEPNKCSMKPFPMLKLLSSTNAIPVMLDEFKAADLKKETVDHILRTMRESYTGQLESKGRADQTTQSYKLDAPLAVIGEWSIQQPAIKERILFARFSKSVKENKVMQSAFRGIKQLPLEAFMPRYISFCLNQDIPKLYAENRDFVEKHLGEIPIAPRILHNLSVMALGLKLFRMFGESYGVSVPEINIGDMLDAQLEEITGNKTGFVRSAVDQLISELSIYAQKNGTLSFGEPWYKQVEVAGHDAVAIRFNQVFPLFKEFAYRTHYEGDLLDKESYLKLFDECEYVIKKDHNVKFDGRQYRSLCIDIGKARSAEIDLEGFHLN